MGINKTSYELIYYIVNLGYWNKETFEYKYLYFGESAVWRIERWI